MATEEKNQIQLFHTGFQEIKEIDLLIGRKNADFGQGFYLTTDYEFSKRWAKERKNEKSIVNHYTLLTDDLKIKIFSRSEEWYHYIYRNRRWLADEFQEYDVIAGPIAHDTIYNVNGITTSGMLDEKQSTYRQYAIKSPKAVKQLSWNKSEELTKDAIAGFRKLVAKEEEAFQTQFAEVLEKVLEES